MKNCIIIFLWILISVILVSGNNQPAQNQAVYIHVRVFGQSAIEMLIKNSILLEPSRITHGLAEGLMATNDFEKYSDSGIESMIIPDNHNFNA